MQLLIEETVKPYTSSVSTVKVPSKGRQSNNLPLDVLMSSIKGMFINYVEYRDYVKRHDLVKNGYPLNPKKAYKHHLSVDQFFGNPEGTALAKQRKDFIENKIWLHAHKRRRELGILSRENRAKQVLSIDQKINIETVCDFLIDRAMTNTVKNILQEPKITLEDARMISNALLKTYENRPAVSKK